MNRRAAICLALGLISLFFNQNCTSGFEAAPGAGNPPKTFAMLAQADCKFVGPDVLRQRLRGVLRIAAGDVPVLDDAGQPTGTMRIASSLATLGKGDPKAGVPDDLTCSAPKFKAAVEIMIDACSIGMTDIATKLYLFPNGIGDYRRVYSAFVGRLPTPEESAAIDRAVSTAIHADPAAAACGIVASSFESLISI